MVTTTPIDFQVGLPTVRDVGKGLGKTVADAGRIGRAVGSGIATAGREFSGGVREGFSGTPPVQVTHVAPSFRGAQPVPGSILGKSISENYPENYSDAVAPSYRGAQPAPGSILDKSISEPYPVAALTPREIGPTGVEMVRQNLPAVVPPAPKPQPAQTVAQTPAQTVAQTPAQAAQGAEIGGSGFRAIETPEMIRLVNALRSGRDAAMTMTSPAAKEMMFSRYLDSIGEKQARNPSLRNMSLNEIMGAQARWLDMQDKAYLAALPESRRAEEMAKRQAQAVMQGNLYRESPDYIQQELVNRGQAETARAGVGAAAKSKADLESRGQDIHRELESRGQDIHRELESRGQDIQRESEKRRNELREKELTLQEDIASGKLSGADAAARNKDLVDGYKALLDPDKGLDPKSPQYADVVNRFVKLLSRLDTGAQTPQPAGAASTVIAPVTGMSTIKAPTGETRQMSLQDARAYAATHPGFVIL